RALRIQNAMGDVLPEGLLIHDQQGAIVYQNHQIELLCSGSRPQHITDVARCILDADSLASWQQSYEACVTDQTAEVQAEYHSTRDGAPRDSLVLSRPVPLE